MLNWDLQAAWTQKDDFFDIGECNLNMQKEKKKSYLQLCHCHVQLYINLTERFESSQQIALMPCPCQFPRLAQINKRRTVKNSPSPARSFSPTNVPRTLKKTTFATHLE